MGLSFWVQTKYSKLKAPKLKLMNMLLESMILFTYCENENPWKPEDY